MFSCSCLPVLAAPRPFSNLSLSFRRYGHMLAALWCTCRWTSASGTSTQELQVHIHRYIYTLRLKRVPGAVACAVDGKGMESVINNVVSLLKSRPKPKRAAYPGRFCLLIVARGQAVGPRAGECDTLSSLGQRTAIEAQRGSGASHVQVAV